tara:strand:+ start:16836 stop:17018 length:183 start_codon:yes stop_codon:yes gene_type:complete
MKYNQKLKAILEHEERNAIWLSKKLSCSHTLCYAWLKGTKKVTGKYRLKIRGLFGSQYGI